MLFNRTKTGMGIIVFSMVGKEKKKFYEHLFISNIFCHISVKLKHTDKNQEKFRNKSQMISVLFPRKI